MISCLKEECAPEPRAMCFCLTAFRLGPSCAHEVRATRLGNNSTRTSSLEVYTTEHLSGCPLAIFVRRCSVQQLR
jgi:hypothetical protein